jgi:hypothetical protein
MAIRTHVRLFDNRAHAEQAVRELEAAGFTSEEISVVGGNRSGVVTDAAHNTEASGTGVGATVGTVLGGGAGLLAGIGALAIPGIGPIVAAGWLVAALTGAGAGAAAGSLLGTLVGSGVTEREAHVHAEGVRRGGTMVTVRAEDARIARAEAILARHMPVDTAAREADYRAGGWTGYREDDSGLISTSPDGTPGNPPGTMASRGADRTLGTNMSGAYPENSEGTARNPPGTAASRALADVAGTNASGARPQHSDGMPGNSPGTAAGRAMSDRSRTGTATGTAGSGQISPRADDDGRILPKTPDGTPGNPPGTEVSRGIDEVAGTNISGAHPENERPKR